MPEDHGMGAEPWLLVRCVWVGEDEARGRALLERLVRAAPPEHSEIGPVSWTQWQDAADALFPQEARGFWRNTAFSRMDEDALDTITAVAAALPGRGTSVDIHHLGGAFSRVPARSTAFPNRTARFWMTINGNWQEPGEDAARPAGRGRELPRPRVHRAPRGPHPEGLRRGDLSPAAAGQTALRSGEPVPGELQRHALPPPARRGSAVVLVAAEHVQGESGVGERTAGAHLGGHPDH